jgi:GntR family transcriptional regulator
VKQHRYEQIAKALSERITSGAVAVGDSLPTEAVLCARYHVSRYTAREALRQLRDAGLITRSSAADLFRYASDTRFVIATRDTVKATGDTLATLGGRRGQEWVRLSGVRRKPGSATPICLITVYLHSALAALAKRIPRSSGVIYPLVEKALGVRITRIDQRIEAVPVGMSEARALKCQPGCGLRVRRYYYDATDRLLEVSDSLHAAERFAYEMRLRRD